MKGVRSVVSAWEGVAGLDLTPSGVRAFPGFTCWEAVPTRRHQAARLLRPVVPMETAAHRAAAAAEARARSPKKPGLRVLHRPAAVAGESKKLLPACGRCFPPRRRFPRRSGRCPILGKYDVVVVGGGTCGFPGRHRRGTQPCQNAGGGVSPRLGRRGHDGADYPIIIAASMKDLPAKCPTPADGIRGSVPNGGAAISARRGRHLVRHAGLRCGRGRQGPRHCGRHARRSRRGARQRGSRCHGQRRRCRGRRRKP